MTARRDLQSAEGVTGDPGLRRWRLRFTTDYGGRIIEKLKETLRAATRWRSLGVRPLQARPLTERDPKWWQTLIPCPLD